MFNPTMVGFETSISSLVTSQISSLVIGRNWFGGTLPNTPNVAGAVLATGGPFNPADPIARKTFQILYRDIYVSTGQAMVDLIVDVFQKQWNLLCDFPGRIYPTTEPGQYIRDPNLMFIFSLNYTYVHVRS